jgi:hypothetical protein
MTGVVMGPGWTIARVRRKLWLPFQNRGTHVQDEREFHEQRGAFEMATCWATLRNQAQFGQTKEFNAFFEDIAVKDALITCYLTEVSAVQLL